MAAKVQHTVSSYHERALKAWPEGRSDGIPDSTTQWPWDTFPALPGPHSGHLYNEAKKHPPSWAPRRTKQQQ